MTHRIDQGRVAARTAFAMLVTVVLCSFGVAAGQERSSARTPIPKTWDDKALSDWATPLSGINVRPSHISSAQYYALPVDNLKTWPVYLSGREPEGYWEMLQRVGPQPLIEPGKLKTQADWIKAGRTVFEQMDFAHLRTFDPRFIDLVRRGESLLPTRDGTAKNVRWVPTKDGVALSFPNCGGCHMAIRPDGTVIPGAPSLAFPVEPTGSPGVALVLQAQMGMRFPDAGSPIQMGPDVPEGKWFFSSSGVPWMPDDVHRKLDGMSRAELAAWRSAGVRGGALLRWNGSFFFPAKIPDLIGIKDRKYIDHTATHVNRGIGDLMRYAALVSTAESTRFGPHEMLHAGSALPKVRHSDEALYALSLYIQSLKPPPNPNPVNGDSRAGEKIFRREGCAGCHVPPLYTNNKLTPAQGFTPPKDMPGTLDVLPVSVGTDPGLALRTRKGTGFYKVPSLRGVWYRGHYLHDGSVASLEEMFDPERLKETHTPGGYSPPGVKNRAIKGHEFGLGLNAVERAQLIAFLRTL